MKRKVYLGLLALFLLLIQSAAGMAAEAGGPVEVTDFASLQEAAAEGQITLSSDLNIAADQTVKLQNCDIELNGHTLTITSASLSADAFSVRGLVSITDSAGGGAIVCKNGGSVFSLTRTGTVRQQGGTIKCENTSGAVSGGYVVTSNGNYQLSGGAIDGNGQYGGICGTAGEIRMTGGEIMNGQAPSRGGGIRTEAGCTFTMSGGIIHDNRVLETGTEHTNFGRGGGVSAKGVVHLLGGTFRGNRATYGGALHLCNDALIQRSLIEDNISDRVGGGIFCDHYSRVVVQALEGEKQAVRIINNRSLDIYGYGAGGIYVEHSNSATEVASLYLMDACITGNKVLAGTPPGSPESEPLTTKQGGGLATCGVSNMQLTSTNGCVIFDNSLDGNTFYSASQDIWCQSQGLVSGVVLGGLEVKYTGRKKNEAVSANLSSKKYETTTVPVDSKLGETVTGQWLSLKTDSSVLTEADKRYLRSICGVLIEGNTTYTKGGGVAGNGYIRLGSTPPDIPEPKDPPPSEKVPELTTHAGTDPAATGKTLAIGEDVAVWDLVSYKNLTPGDEYELHSTLCDAGSHAYVIPADEAVVTTFTPEESSGTITVEMRCNTASLPQRTLVVIQELYKDGVLIADHFNFRDEAQQVTVERLPISITTDAKIMGERNGQDVEFAGNQDFDSLPVQESIHLEPLTPQTDYMVVCSIMDKPTGEVIFSREMPLKATKAAMDITMQNLYLPLRDMTGSAVVLGVELYEGKELAASHTELMDLRETLKITDAEDLQARTNAALEQTDGLRRWTLTDSITIDDAGKWIEGGYLLTQIADQETGEILFETEQQVNDDYGGWEGLKSVITQDTEGRIVGPSLLAFHEGEKTFPAAAYAGRPLVVYETLQYYGNEVVHADPNDTSQTFVFSGPAMESDASVNGAQICAAALGNVITDDVLVSSWPEQSGALPAGSVLKGSVINRDTDEVVAQHEADVSGAAITDGSIRLQNTFTIDMRQMSNQDLVVMEQLIIGGIVRCSHENLQDDRQTILVDPHKPEITTRAAAEDGSKEVPAAVSSTISDAVELRYLKPGREYTLKGVLSAKSTGEELSGTEAEVTFRASAAQMSLENTFLYTVGANAGDSIVVFERLYTAGKLVAEHTDLEDEAQTVIVRGGTFKTTAAGANGEKELPISGSTVVTDRLDGGDGKFEPDTYLTVESWLVNRETGVELTIGETPYRHETTIYVAGDGVLRASVDLTFSSFGLADQTWVVFEEIRTAAGSLIAEHKDIHDDAQAVTFRAAPAITTDASGPNGEKALDAGIIKVHDKVAYSGLNAGQSYTLQSEIVCVQDGQSLDSIKSAFSAEEADGTTAAEFKFSARQHAGHTLAVYEEVYNEAGDLVAYHVDASDARQQVAINPKFQTTAAGPDGAKYLQPSADTVIEDRIEYDGLAAGRSYTLEGKLVVADTGRVLQTKKETLRAATPGGTYQMTFEADTTRLAGKRLVVMYRLLSGNTIAAMHSDPDNIDQSVYIIEAGKKHIMTSAALADGSKSIEVKKETTVHFTDEIHYCGLQPGHVYGIFSHLFDAATGEEYAPSGSTLNMMNRGEESRFMTFEPTNASGTISVPMHFRVKAPRMMDLVVGQQIYDLGYVKPMTPWWNEMTGQVLAIYDLVMEQMDLSDQSETIHLKSPNVETRALQTDSMPEAPDIRTPWQKLKDAVLAGETFTLTEDIHGTADAGAQNVILATQPGAVIDLAGYTLTVANDGSAPTVRVAEGAGLRIENGTIESGHSGAFAENSGTLMMEDVSLNASRVSTSLIMNHGRAEIADCTLDGCEKVNNCIINTPADGAARPDLTLSGSTVVTGGEVRSSGVASGAGIHSTGADSAVTLKGSAVVRDCESPADGGGIRMAGGTLRLQESSRVLDCTSAASGGGIYADQGAALEISGNAAVYVCEAKKSGGGVYISAGSSVSLTEQASVSDCDSASGGGIYADRSTDVIMNGGATVKNCSVSQHGGGVYSCGSVTVTGAASIAGCTSARAGGGIYSPEAACSVTISENAQITDCHADSSNAEHGGGAIYADGTTTVSGSALIARCETAWLGGGIANRGTLTVTDNAVIKDCRANGNSYGGGGIVNYGTAALGGNVRITGCSAVRSGGAFYNYGANSTLVADGSVTISECKANYCGGIYNYQGTATITGTSISDCAALLYDGGGFYNNAGNATLNSTTIAGCTANVSGGGLYNSAGKTTLNSTTITGCTALNNGGGAYSTGTSAVLTLDEDAAIRNCSTNADGGGVFVASGTGTIKGNTEIDGCEAQASGGGLYANTGAKLNLEENAVVRDCTATSLGGGMFINGGTVYMSGSAAFEDCSAAGFGGGATWVNNSGRLTMSDDTVIRSCTAQNGGGIYNANSCTVTMQGNALITGCSATTAGGAVFNTGANSKFTIKSVATITGNTCSTSGKGAGIHCASGTVTTYSTTAIGGNTPTNSYGTIATDSSL